MSEAAQTTTVLVTTWLVGAAAGGGLYALSKSQFPVLSEKSERYRKLILIGFVPCCGLNIFLAVIYYFMFLARAKLESNRTRKAEQSLTRGLGSSTTPPGANPFGSGGGDSAASGPSGPNPFGSSGGTQAPGGSGSPNPFGEPPASKADDTDNPFA